MRAWNRFFFEPTSPATIGLYRITFGIVVFLAILGKYPCREIFYGEHAIVSKATMSLFFPGSPILFFKWLPQTEPALQIYFLGIMAAAVLLTIGLFTRVASILVFLGLITLSNRNFMVDNAGDDLMRINALILMLSEAGAAYSVDRWLRVRKGKETPVLALRSPWAQRLLQLQLAYLYLDTAYLKFHGASWMDGTALYYALGYVELRRFNFKYLFYYLWQIKLMTWSVLALEIGAGSLIWFKPLRLWVTLAAISLHLGINLTMQFPIFQYVMISSLINFIDPEHIERWVAALRRLARERSIKALASEAKAA